MADPVLDEQHIIELLRSPSIPENVNRMQAGAVQALMDLFDRKVTREEFTNNASKCLLLYATASRLNILANMQAVYDAGNLSDGEFARATSELSHLMRIQSEGVVDMVERLKLCPTSQDLIH